MNKLSLLGILNSSQKNSLEIFVTTLFLVGNLYNFCPVQTLQIILKIIIYCRLKKICFVTL